MATTKPAKRRKPAKARKDDQIRIRVTEEQKRAFTDAAERAGLDVSSWLRSLGMREVQHAAPAPEPARR